MKQSVALSFFAGWTIAFLVLVPCFSPLSRAEGADPSDVPTEEAAPATPETPPASPEPASPEPSEPGSVPPTSGTETNQMVSPDLITAEKAWRSFLQIQGQLDTALLAIERNRRESEAVSQSNQEKINEGLVSIEKVLQAQQEREIEALRESNRNMLIVAGAFAGVGFLVMFLTSLFHFRAMNRLTGLAATLPYQAGYGAPLLGMEEERMLHGTAGASHGQAPGQRLLSAIERLEKRVHELEHGTSSPNPPTIETEADANEDRVEAGTNGAYSSLVGKGQTLLNLGQTEEALLCFEEVLTKNPGDAETLVKKGTALEKLNRLDEAIACYDQAIAVNQSMTLAYLYKGGLFNRMERYNEALACYEQALKTQQHSPAAAGLSPSEPSHQT